MHTLNSDSLFFNCGGFAAAVAALVISLSTAMLCGLHLQLFLLSASCQT